jgi:hypothetical protein
MDKHTFRSRILCVTCVIVIALDDAVFHSGDGLILSSLLVVSTSGLLMTEWCRL